MSSSPLDPTERFSNRVDDYVKFRPRYPRQVIDILCEETDFKTTSVIADVGSGTGISAELFLNNGNTVFAIEPNAPMRAAAESLLGHNPGFHSVAGTAEHLTLPAHCADYVVAAQAFHWFDHAAAKAEFSRILRPNGWVVLLWNSRRTDSSPFLRDYETLLQRYATDYRTVNHRNLSPSDLASFFNSESYRFRTLDNEQRFDFAGLQGRLLSSSYAPSVSDPGHAAMLAELRQLFDKHAVNGQICFDYDLEIHIGHVS